MGKPQGSLRQRCRRLFQQKDRVTVRDLMAVTYSTEELYSMTFTWYNLRVCLAMEGDMPEMDEALYFMMWRTL